MLSSKAHHLGFAYQGKVVGHTLASLRGLEGKNFDCSIFPTNETLEDYAHSRLRLDMTFSQLMEDPMYRFPYYRELTPGQIGVDKIQAIADRKGMTKSLGMYIFEEERWNSLVCSSYPANYVIGDCGYFADLSSAQAAEWMEVSLVFSEHLFSKGSSEC